MGASNSTDSGFCSKDDIDFYGCCAQQRGSQSTRGIPRFDESEHRKVAASVAKIRSVFKDRWNTHGKDVLAMEKEVQSTVINVAVMEERTCVEILRRLSPSERKEWVLTLQSCLQRVRDNAESPQAFISRFGLRQPEASRLMYLLDNPREVNKLNIQSEAGPTAHLQAAGQQRTPHFLPTPSDPLRRFPSSGPPQTQAQAVGQWNRDGEKSQPAAVPAPLVRRSSSANIEAVQATYYANNPVINNPAIIPKLERRPSRTGSQTGIERTGSSSSGEGAKRERRRSVDASPPTTPERRSRTNSVSSQTKPRSRTNSVSTPSKGEFIDPLGFKRGVPSGHAIDMKNYKPSDQCHTEEDARRFEAKTKLLVGKELAWETAYDPAAKVV